MCVCVCEATVVITAQLIEVSLLHYYTYHLLSFQYRNINLIKSRDCLTNAREFFKLTERKHLKYKEPTFNNDIKLVLISELLE